MSQGFDLAITGATVVIPGVGEVDCDLGIADGRVSEIGTVDASSAAEVIDASGHHLLPGIVDPHVHFGNQLSFEEETLTETRAALLGGVTTVGVMLLNFTDPYEDYMKMVRDSVEKRSFADVFCHMGMFDAHQIDSIPDFAREFGVRSFKFFMSGAPGICPGVDDGTMRRGFKRIAELGSDALACVHAENGALVAAAKAELERATPDGGLAEWALAHPPLAEELAIVTAERLSREAEIQLYVVHVSSIDGLARGAELKAHGSSIFLETTSPYLSSTVEDEIGLLAKMIPPIRDSATREALWSGVKSGAIDVVGTDNTARDSAGKAPEKGLHGCGVGLPVLGTHLPAMLHFGHHERQVSLELISRVAAKRPAEIFGLYPRKGTICIGGDADLAIVDLSEERVVVPEELGSYADFTPLQGKRLIGWPVGTVKAGRLVAKDGEVLTEPGNASYLEVPPREPARSANTN